MQLDFPQPRLPNCNKPHLACCCLQCVEFATTSSSSTAAWPWAADMEASSDPSDGAGAGAGVGSKGQQGSGEGQPGPGRNPLQPPAAFLAKVRAELKIYINEHVAVVCRLAGSASGVFEIRQCGVWLLTYWAASDKVLPVCGGLCGGGLLYVCAQQQVCRLVCVGMRPVRLRLGTVCGDVAAHILGGKGLGAGGAHNTGQVVGLMTRYRAYSCSFTVRAGLRAGLSMPERHLQ
ncbi:hypothetical protein HaLaN_00935 [Haematococcus lacustris]|uniref:Uncharacterized protein n=1 Tax=Haematococcus lacustris TaxID=44745 RepID=A0A699YAE4_HAELA|nr:hypothetical protein HaLaN_00935 [Haematococcus lacustris]